MRIRKAKIVIFIIFLFSLLLAVGVFFFAQQVQKVWDDQKTWNATSGVLLPSYDLSQFKITSTQSSSGEVLLDINYCLLLDSVNTTESVTLRCSLLPRALAVLNLFDPYRWMPENGISIVLPKNNYPETATILSKNHIPFQDLQVSGLPSAVSMKVKYSNGYPKPTIANKLIHFIDVKKGGKTDISTTYESVEINKVKEYSELTVAEKQEFGRNWTKNALGDFEEQLKLKEIQDLQAQELLNSMASSFRAERFVCTITDKKLDCRNTLDGNPAESVLYYASLKQSILGKKVTEELEKRMFPFVPKGSEFQVYCTHKEDDPNCQAWSEMSLYQYPYCPFNEILTPNSDQAAKDLFMKYASYWKTPADMVKKMNTYYDKFISQGGKTEQLSNSEFLILSKQYCKYALESKIPYQDLEKSFMKLVDLSLFRSATTFNSNGVLVNLTIANLEEGLYNSDAFTPYKYSFVADDGSLVGALKEGYSRESLEGSMGYSYNMFATIVALYLMQGRYGN
jgi:hypothetical protein